MMTNLIVASPEFHWFVYALIAAMLSLTAYLIWTDE